MIMMMDVDGDFRPVAEHGNRCVRVRKYHRGVSTILWKNQSDTMNCSVCFMQEYHHIVSQMEQ